MDGFSVVLVILVLGVVAHRATLTYFRTHAARQMMGEERPFTKDTADYTKTLLVLGDSTAAGVGALRPEDSIAGRLSDYIGATYVENHATSGAAVADLKPQIDKASRNFYDYILIQIGGNDILLLHDARATARKLDLVMMTLPDAGTTILMAAGNVGGATIFPLFARPFHTLASLVYRTWFKKVAQRRRVVYVDLYEPRAKDVFIQAPERYLSEDGLHPSSEGYAHWFEKVKASIRHN